MSNRILQGTGGRWGFLKQSAFDTPQTVDSAFYYLAFTNCDFGPVQGQGQLPPEAGNDEPLPRGVFKTGVHAEGGVDFLPRLENRLGYWLEAVFGDVSDYADQNIAQVIADAGTTVGCHTHLFGFQDLDKFELPYLTVHRFLPSHVTADEVGEIIQDVRVAAWTLQANAAAVVASRGDMLGRASGATVWDINPGWSPPSLDDDSTFMVTACDGEVKISITSGTPSTLTDIDTSVIGMQVVNALLPPGRSRRIGSPHPKDYPVLSRIITLNVIVYLSDYDLYVQTFAAGADPVVDAAWSCEILAGDIDFTLASPAPIGATGEDYKLRFRTTAGNVQWRCRPIVLVPNQPVLLALTGTIVPATSGRDFELYIQNDHASYA